MPLSRRDFLKIMGGATAAVVFPTVLIQGCKKALQKLSGRTNVIWLQGLSCGGCSLSLLNSMDPDILTLITHTVNLDYHPRYMTGSGSQAMAVLHDVVQQKDKDFVLIIEGAVPAESDMLCTFGRDQDRQVGIKEWITKLVDLSQTSKNLKGILATGTCASFGGVAAAQNNASGAVGVRNIVRADVPVINVPGCPPHPDWIAGTLLALLLRTTIDLDEYNRPRVYYGKTVHDTCERLYDYKRGTFAKNWGDEGCLYNLGCLGIDTGCDISKRTWLHGAGSCTACGTGCIGCTEKEFPDYGKRGLFAQKKAFLKG